MTTRGRQFCADRKSLSAEMRDLYDSERRALEGSAHECRLLAELRLQRERFAPVLRGAATGHDDFLTAVLGDLAHEPIGGVAARACDFRSGDQELELERLAQ